MRRWEASIHSLWFLPAASDTTIKPNHGALTSIQRVYNRYHDTASHLNALQSTMPPKVNPPDERPSRLKLPFISDRHKRASSTDPASSHPETPSDQGGSKFNTGKALRITSKVLDALKIVGEASPLLGPLKTTCDGLKIVVAIAEVRT
jgi:hypothetical protein